MCEYTCSCASYRPPHLRSCKRAVGLRIDAPNPKRSLPCLVTDPIEVSDGGKNSKVLRIHVLMQLVKDFATGTEASVKVDLTRQSAYSVCQEFCPIRGAVGHGPTYSDAARTSVGQSVAADWPNSCNPVKNFGKDYGFHDPGACVYDEENGTPARMAAALP
jgi:hypothetical protein